MGFYSNRIFPYVIDFLMSNPAMTTEREFILKDVGGDILEIGFGTGLNLPFYPKEVRKITVIDPNAGMKERARRRIAESGIEVDSRVLSGENLPMEDASFDSVVCTWTLCSIPDVAKALREVRRVLRPGGRFFFVEHGLSDRPSIQKWQNRINPIQRVIGDGCNLNRPIDKLIAAEGLQIQSLDRFNLAKMPSFASHHYRGIAAK
jgi:ubiquinone/menaquinone biosynthesis C-methylase UbiE